MWELKISTDKKNYKKNGWLLMKEEIKNYAEEIGVDDIGFASLKNYKSPNSPPIKEIYSKDKNYYSFSVSKAR